MNNLLQQHIRQVYGNNSECARQLGVTPTTVFHWCQSCPRCFLKYLGPHLANIKMQDFFDDGTIGRDKDNVWNVFRIVEATQEALNSPHEEARQLQGSLD